MKNVLIATHLDFWRLGAGARARIHRLAQHLARRTRLTIVCTAPGSEPDDASARAMSKGWSFVWLDRDGTLDRRGHVERFRQLLDEHAIEVCIVVRRRLSWLLDGVPSGVRMMLDTNDLSSDLGDRMRRFGQPHGPEVTWDQELAEFRRYDSIILIQGEDHEKVSALLGPERCVLAPHPPPLRQRAIRPRATNIAFVASRWIANVDGLQWFCSEVWRRVRRPDVQLHLYGHICEALRGTAVPATVVGHGFVPDLDTVYDEIDIAINPVRFGAGLKIKSVEALGSGLPLVTTREGARGLESLDGTALLIADTADEFLGALHRLVDDHALRRSLGDAAFRFASVELSPDACFGALLAEIERPAPRC